MEGPQSIGALTSHDRTYDRVSLLEQLVHEDERLERLHFVRQDGLGTQSIPHRQRRVVVPSVDDALWPLASRFAIPHPQPRCARRIAIAVLGSRPLTSYVLLLCRGSATIRLRNSWTYWEQSPPDS